MFTAIIVDDEYNAREVLRGILVEAVPGVKVIGDASNINELKKLLASQKPDILFLDIFLGKQNILEFIPDLDVAGTNIIFTTAHDDFILQAMRLSALDYLLKPVSKEDMQQALNRLESEKRKNVKENLEIFKYNMDNPLPGIKKIALPTGNRLEIVALGEIIYCEGDGAYTIFYLTDKRKILVSKNLHEFERLFYNCGFCRVHHSKLINIPHIKTYIKGEGGSVIMSNGNEIEVSRRKKSELMSMLIK